MATLGDYIHYYWKNYKQYGTYRNGKSNYGLASSIFLQEREDMISKLGNKKKYSKELEQALQGMIYPTVAERDM